MKRNRSITLMLGLMISILSFACSLLAPDTPATPTSDPYIFEPVTTPLKIEPDSLPKGQTGAAYEVEIRVSDNVTPVSDVSISDGALPAGLELVFVNQEGGIKISGTPEQTGTFTFTVVISCFGTMVSGQTGQKEYTIIVE
ncbi:MAG: putative Ig domain-containing protein [Anaerolineales bacterium]